VPAQVLVVEDDAFTCELIREILCSAGMPSLERNPVEGALRMARIYLAA
jgi:CheY-like chemotaxis protein